jgi:hypothetical protein
VRRPATSGWTGAVAARGHVVGNATSCVQCGSRCGPLDTLGPAAAAGQAREGDPWRLRHARRTLQGREGQVPLIGREVGYHR